MKNKRYDPSAIGSDIPRSKKQYIARLFASYLVSLLRLNRPGFLTTEIVQQIYPICSIPTRYGDIKCKCDHGRLRWRVITFYGEEPETIKWLDSITREDVLWDIGANVGLYSIYAAKGAKCRVIAVEPEAQNYATLVENIVLNNVQDRVEAMSAPITRVFGIGRLYVHAITKGGAYNQFLLNTDTSRAGAKEYRTAPVTQLQFGVSLDELVAGYHLEQPTHVKIDVDGNEPEIIAGAREVLRHPRCRSLLIEVQRGDPAHEKILVDLEESGYRCVSKRSNWESRSNRQRESEHPATNMIFVRD